MDFLEDGYILFNEYGIETIGKTPEEIQREAIKAGVLVLANNYIVGKGRAIQALKEEEKCNTYPMGANG